MNNSNKQTERMRKLLAFVKLRINDKRLRKVFFIFTLLILIIGAAVGTLTIIRNIEALKEEKKRDDFYDQYLVFSAVTSGDNKRGYNPVCISEPTIDGIHNWTYMTLELYKKETSNILTFDQVLDYLSQEFEDNGDIRIYTNGRHPEIAAYIKWARLFENVNLRNKYCTGLSFIYWKYASDVREHQVFPECSTTLLPIEMVDELIKKEADPDYELDLISIQNRYIEEGRARVIDDETIEYIIPEST